MRVSEKMTPAPTTIRPDTPYYSVLRTMQDLQVHHLPVVDKQGKLLGIVAERDLLVAISAHISEPLEISEVMHGDVITASPDMPIAEAATLMADRKIGALPVLEGDKVVGIITKSDIFHAFVDFLNSGGELKLPAKI